MDYYEVLFKLTTLDENGNEEVQNFDTKLQQILQKVQSTLKHQDEKFEITSNKYEDEHIDIRYQYIRTVVYVLQNIKASGSLNNESLISVKQFHVVKVCIELITAMGIIPGLLPGVGIDMAKLCPKALQIHEEKLTDLQKYKRIQFTVLSLMELYDELMFRPAILAQIGPLLAALLQLSHAPLMKPCKKSILNEQGNTSKPEFKMTEDLYNELRKDQEHFIDLLQQLLNNCPMSTSMKELMVILGVKGTPKWLQNQTRKYLVKLVMQPNGIISIIVAVCEDVLDLGEHWNKLDTISRLVTMPHGNDIDEYYKSICSQLVQLLTSSQIKHSATIANCCITALYECNPDICLKNVVEVICEPLIINERNVSKSENEVEKCIENLTKCFVTVEAKFKHLPCTLLTRVAVPLFCLYNNARQSACLLKCKIKQLILHLLNEESSRHNVFAAFLGHSEMKDFGNRLTSKLGPTGGIEITGIDETPKYEEFADTLFDLISATKVLSNELFTYLLKFLSNTIQLNREKQTENLLQTADDMIERVEEQLVAVKLLSSLANVPAVQDTQLEKPETIFSFIKSLFSKYIKNKNDISEEDDCEILYISLMLIKIIISERKKSLDWTVFNDFVKFLKECCSLSHVPKQLMSLTRELIELIEIQGRSKQKHYQDLSVDCKRLNKFEEALKDLADPLLPVRAHGLITLTKLIENADPCATTKKEFILQLFQENLKHEDSFIYLAAINGLHALAMSYPQVVIETLVHEYINMPQRISAGELTVETRVKLGEVLVKMTRALGEMASAYKNILINGFLCAARDPDSLVRSSSLSCLGELCKVLGFRLGDIVIEVIYCISCIVKSDKAPECRRAAVMVSTMLLRGLGKNTLTSLGKDLVDLYRGLKYLRDNDEDPVLRLHAQLALEELDHIMRDFLFSPPKLEKRILLLN
ncbi:transport and golgi organization 6 isoform X1 [Megachile rotundata]|uniref:transport and golgi organization 6 isoform X1 n=2 Tax=Megachile rotundata TaxID=143995 RepID=UPI003FD34466